MMKNNPYFRVAALAIVLGIALASCRLLRTLIPLGVLPELDIPNMVLISLLALLWDQYLVPGSKPCDVFLLTLSALVFGLLPYAAGFAGIGTALKLALVGGIVFTLTAWLFSQMQDRLSTGPTAKIAPVFSALGLYLAAQCFSGMIL